MIIAATAVAVALVIALLTFALVRLARSWSRAAEERLAAAVSDLNTRMESMVRELGEALERAEEEGRRDRRLTEVAGSIELDEVLRRTLEATREIPRADAAVVSLSEAGDGKPLVASLGLSREEAERHGLVTGPPDGRPARAIAISFRYRLGELAANDSLIHGGLAVPLSADEVQIGHLAVFTRSSDAMLGDDALEGLERIASYAAPALENARRFNEARRQADLDALTGLHNRRYFHETLAREVARAHRYGRKLALLVLDVDGFKTVNDEIGHLEGDAVLAATAERIRGAVRSADVACRVGGDEFGVILPESTLSDAERLSSRIQRAIGAEPLSRVGALSLSAGVAELNGDEDARTLFERTDSALYRAKASGRGRVETAQRANGSRARE
jgi:diguanylate cyclase (GGDEF)-like protein